MVVKVHRSHISRHAPGIRHFIGVWRIRISRAAVPGTIAAVLFAVTTFFLLRAESALPHKIESAADASRDRAVQVVAAWPYVRFKVVHSVLPQGLVGVSLSLHHNGVFASGGYNGLQSVSDVRQVFPRQRLLAHLPAPTHDAASGWIGPALYVFGGGQATSYNTIVQIQPPRTAVVGQLPSALSDAGMVPYADGVLLIGGHNGNTFSTETFLYTRKVSTLRAKGLFRLPVGLRYAGVALLGDRLWITGGRTATGMSREIYYVAPGSKQAQAVGRLPLAIDKAAAWAVPGYVLIAGGQTLQGVPQRKIYAFNTLTRQIRVVGILPTPLADMGYAAGSRGVYLVGGATAANLSALSRNLIVIYTTWFR